MKEAQTKMRVAPNYAAQKTIQAADHLVKLSLTLVLSLSLSLSLTHGVKMPVRDREAIGAYPRECVFVCVCVRAWVCV